MPTHTDKERAKRKRKVASNGTKPKAKNKLGGIKLKSTKKKEKEKRIKKAMA